MPVYEYCCPECGRNATVYTVKYDVAPPKCDICGAETVKKLSKGTSFILKGGGWYADGYSKGNNGG